ncbi:MAG TPA: PEP-utilizing enzyme [Pseudonocardia sp.]|nr:PEP-utilizing enzyme [Pseudonocardia sp.]
MKIEQLLYLWPIGRGGPELSAVESWNPMHTVSIPGRHWSRGNIGEALPGVLTPLTWSLWEVAAEGGTRAAFHALGAATTAERAVPTDRSEGFIRAFHGRGAAQLEFLCAMGDRIPGTSGAAIAEQVFGAAPPELVGRRDVRRYPVIAAKLPWTSMRAPSILRAAAAETEAWWRTETGRAASLELAGATALFTDAADRFRRNVALQATTLFCVVQPVYDLFEKLASRAGIADLTGLASGYGAVPETAVVGDLWRVSRGELTMAQLVDRHGFHGPREAELAARVWREDSAPLRRLVAEYAATGDAQDPALRETRLRSQRVEVERRILAALPWAARPGGRLLLARAARVIPLRGIAKDAYLQAEDVIRAAARRTGELLERQGALADAEDVFFLTDAEIERGVGDEARDLVTRRRERFEHYKTFELPTTWVGDPEPIQLDTTSPGDRRSRRIDGGNRGQTAGSVDHPARADTEVLAGVGVSPGVVEGPARVVTDPSFDDVEPGEVLVAPATDPSWASIMFLSSALVVDIGGALSHAAIVARELGVPCVVNTGTGTRTIRTGDHVRVDGGTGVVTILKRARQS